MRFIPKTTTPPDASKIAFRTHLNYIKCLEKLLSDCTTTAQQIGTPQKQTANIERFLKLHKVTQKSIKIDVDLARENSTFAVIVAPWLPVKCYYALYYLESVLTHLLNGTPSGFEQGGHTGVRRQIYSLASSNSISFTVPELSHVYTLTEIRGLSAIGPGQNARAEYWRKPECVNSIAKKLMDYKLRERKHKWNLHTKKHREEQKQFIAKERLMILDFFYWYRIKANYRDLDYIDFENGITENEVLEYTETYFNAFEHYRAQLLKQIKKLHPVADSILQI